VEYTVMKHGKNLRKPAPDEGIKSKSKSGHAECGVSRGPGKRGKKRRARGAVNCIK